jgi:hypothetical protein
MGIVFVEIGNFFQSLLHRHTFRAMAVVWQQFGKHKHGILYASPHVP